MLTRGKNQEDLIEKYINKSNGILFMYGTTENESAKEYSKLNHGLFTYYFLESINNDKNYDADGILTPNRIQDIIAKATSEASGFKQTPVIESRTIGYYPFAFKPEIIKKSNSLNTPISATRKNDDTDVIDNLYFPNVPETIRKQLFIALRMQLDNWFLKQTESETFQGYQIVKGTSASTFPSFVSKSIDERLLDETSSQKVPFIGGLSSSETIDASYNYSYQTHSIIESFIGRKKPKIEIKRWIHWSSDDIIGKALYCKSNDINLPSAGFLIAVYQSIYGIGLGTTSFYLDYNGYGESEIKGHITSINAFKVNENTIQNVLEQAQQRISEFQQDIIKWKERRKKDILDFDKKAI